MFFVIFSFPETKLPDGNSNWLEERFNLTYSFLGVLVHHGGEGRIQCVCPWRWEGEAMPIHLS